MRILVSALALCGSLIASPVSSQTWEEVYTEGGSNGQWAEVVCQEGAGWRKCEKSEPTWSCKYQANYNQVTQGKGSCRGSPSFTNKKYVLNGTYPSMHYDSATIKSGAIVGTILQECRGIKLRVDIMQICVLE